MGFTKGYSIIVLFIIICIILVTLVSVNQFFFSKYIYDLNIKRHIDVSKNILVLTNHAINNYFSFLTSNLYLLTNYNDIINFNEHGKMIFNEYYNNYSGIYSNITRIDNKGNINYTVPYRKDVIGKSVLHQFHNKRLFDEHKTIISIPFTALQGNKAIAIAVPIFKNGKFDGSVSGLIPFNAIWDKYVSKIYITDNTFILVTDKFGNIIYTTVQIKDLSNIKQILNYFYNSIELISDFNKEFNSTIIQLKNNDKLKFEKGEYFITGTHISIDNNNWIIFAFTPMKDIKKMSDKINKTQSIFTYLIIILFILIAIIFLVYQSMKIQEKNKALYLNSSEKQKIMIEKNFYELIIKSFMESRDLAILITLHTGEIKYNSKALNIKHNIFDYIPSNKKVDILTSLNFIKEKSISSLMLFPLDIDNNIKKFFFNVHSIEYENNKYLIFSGFEYKDNFEKCICSDKIDKNLIDWFNSNTPLTFINRSGIVIFSNNLFNKTFPNTKSLFDILDNSVHEKLKTSINLIINSLNEFSEYFIIDDKEYFCKFIPIINEFAKVEYILISFNK